MKRFVAAMVVFLLGSVPAMAQDQDEHGPITSDPSVSQNLRSARSVAFKAAVFPVNATAPTSAAGDEEETASRTGGRISEMSSDIEYESFNTPFDVDGTNLAINASYLRTNATGDWLYGGNVVLNSLNFDIPGIDAQLYTTVELYVNRMLRATLDQEMFVGLSANTQLNDVDGADSAINIGLHAVQRHWMSNGGALTYGVRGQFSSAGDFSSTLGNAAVMYGMPIGDALALNLDMLLVYTISQSFDGTDITPDKKIMLNPGATVTWFASPSFGLNLGVKTVLLVEDYSSFEFVLGGRFRF